MHRFYNLARGDHDMESLHSLPPSGETEIRDDMSSRTLPRSEASHQPRQAMSSDDVANQSSAVAGYTNEIERQRQLTENERLQQELIQNRQLESVRQEAASVLQPTTQTLTEQHAQNAERVRQQVLAEAEEQHNRKKDEYQKEVLEQLRIDTEEAQRTTQQVQQQAQQEAQHIVGSVMNFAEQAHRNKHIAQKNITQQAEAKLNEKISKTNIKS